MIVVRHAYAGFVALAAALGSWFGLAAPVPGDALLPDWPSLFAAGDPAPKGPTLEPGKVVTAEVGKKCVVAADTTATRVTWKIPAGCDTLALNGKSLAVWANPGRYVFTAMVPSGDDVLSTEIVLTVTGPRPPPGPTPDPGPTPPTPTPTPAPIPEAGFRVLVVYESADLTKMPPAQQAVLYSKAVRDYLNAKCAVGADGKTREWRMWDFDVDGSADGKLWGDAMKRKPAKDKLPWLVVSTGKDGYEGPLPATVDEALKLLKKYGGE